MKLIIYKNIKELINKIMCKLKPKDFINFVMDLLEDINPDNEEILTFDRGTRIIEVKYKHKYGYRK